MRDAETVIEFLDGAYEFDEAGFRAATIENVPQEEMTVAADD
ncbi:hypothetical protein [Halalkalicoccus salilacus]